MRPPFSPLPLIALVVLVAAIIPLQKWLDSIPYDDHSADEVMFMSSGESVKRLAFGYEALLADIYWMRTVQYFGRTILKNPEIVNRQDRASFRLLPTLIDITTTLDPHYVPAYRFGGMFIHDYIDPVLSYPLLEKGIRENPDNLFLYQDLAFSYWSDGRCEEAARVYDEAARLPDAPPWMTTMAANVIAECGNRAFAREMYARKLESTDDPRVREEIMRKLQGIQALDEVEMLRAGVTFYREQTGQFPPSLAVLLRQMSFPKGPGKPTLTVNSKGEPLDPNGVPYVYTPDTGEITTNPQSMKLPAPIFRNRGQ
jgi:hypothetical protein